MADLCSYFQALQPGELEKQMASLRETKSFQNGIDSEQDPSSDDSNFKEVIMQSNAVKEALDNYLRFYWASLEVCFPTLGTRQSALRYFIIIDRSEVSVGRVLHSMMLGMLEILYDWISAYATTADGKSEQCMDTDWRLLQQDPTIWTCWRCYFTEELCGNYTDAGTKDY